MTFSIVEKLKKGDRIYCFDEENMMEARAWLDARGYKYTVLVGEIEVL